MAQLKIEIRRASKLLSKYCEARTSCNNGDGSRLLHVIKGEKVVLIESLANYGHPDELTERPVAQFEYKETTKSWSLFGYNRESKSLLYVKGCLEKLIQVMDEDLTGVFWIESNHRTRCDEAHI